MLGEPPAEKDRDTDLDAVPDAIEFLPQAPKPKAAIYEAPLPRHALPAMVFLLCSYALSSYSWGQGRPRDYGISYVEFVERFEYWRCFTALLAHAHIGHFLSNSWLILVFGWFLRDVSGSRAFPLAALGLGMITNILTVFTMHPHGSLVGASGMAYVMAGMWLVVFFRFTPISVSHRMMRALAFVLMVLTPSIYQPQVSYTAHAIGFVLGLLVGPLLPLRQRRKPDRAAIAGLH